MVGEADTRGSLRGNSSQILQDFINCIKDFGLQKRPQDAVGLMQGLPEEEW